jgi:hypothetical protein
MSKICWAQDPFWGLKIPILKYAISWDSSILAGRFEFENGGLKVLLFKSAILVDSKSYFLNLPFRGTQVLGGKI